jgi:threonine synthase
VAAFEHGDDRIQPVESTTRISGLSVPFDIDAGQALSHLRKSGGRAFAVSDEEVFAAQQMLLSQEGIYAEPAGAAALAGLCRALRDGVVRRTDTVVCLVTGHGFKDPDSVSLAASRYPATLVEVADLRDAISGLIRCA